MLQNPIVMDYVILEEMNVELFLIVQVKKQPELKTLKVMLLL